MTIYTGDLLIALDEDGNFDIDFQNGQPQMTNGFETMVLLAVFGEDYFGNDIVDHEYEKMKSDFPNVIKRNTVTDKTKNDGTAAIQRALDFMIELRIAEKIIVSAEIVSVHAISWLVEIYRPETGDIKFQINWDNGELTAKFSSDQKAA